MSSQIFKDYMVKPIVGAIIFGFGFINWIFNFFYYVLNTTDQNFLNQSIFNSFIPQFVGSIILINSFKKRTRKIISKFGFYYFNLGFLGYILAFYHYGKFVVGKDSFFLGITLKDNLLLNQQAEYRCRFLNIQTLK